MRVITQIQAKMVKEWIEKEWRFKELALDQKLYTGRSYPCRQYLHTVTLKDGKTITGELAEVFFVQPIVFKADEPLASRPDDSEPVRVILHKRDKGDFGAELKSMKYVKLIKLGKEALEEGRKKAAHQPSGKSSAETGEGVRGGQQRREVVQSSRHTPCAVSRGRHTACACYICEGYRCAGG